MRKKLGECLIQAGLISEDDLLQALSEQTRTGERVGIVLVRLNLVTEKQVTKAVAYHLGFPYVNLTEEPPDRGAIVLVPKDVALERECVAIKLEGNLLTVAMSDPLLTSLVQDLELRTGHRIKQVVATRSDILDAIHSGYPSAAAMPHAIGSEATPDSRVSVSWSGAAPSIDAGSGPLGRDAEDDVVDQADRSGKSAEGAAVDELIDLILHGVLQSGARDVHVDPMEKRVAVRHRLDGLLTDAMELPRWVQEPVIARLKTMAGMDATETRVSQQGRLCLTRDDGTAAEFRAFTLPTLLGEKIVFRALDSRQAPIPFEELGLSASAMDDVRRFLRKAHGLILVTGPAGSGNTTTLSSAVSSMISRRTSIVTIENSIEYRIDGVNQTQVNEDAELSFAPAVEAVLQQDPDVVVVGELRDRETATVVLRAAERGKLILSSVHAGDAISAVTGLADLTNDRSAIASALVGVVAQRLVRRLCLSCRRQHTPDGDTLRALSIPESSAGEVVFYHPVGCDACHHTGYRGRTALFEVMRVTGKVRHLIARHAGEDLIRDAALAAGMVSLGEDGIGKVKAGITSAEELLRVVHDVRHRRSLCPKCSGAVALDFRICPQCGHRLGVCSKCSRSVQPDWKYCPYCSAGMVSHKKKKKLKNRKASEPPASNVAEFKNQNR